MRKQDQEQAAAEKFREKFRPRAPTDTQKRPASVQNPLIDLQRSAGNQAVAKLLGSGAIQAKLRVSQPGDADELEADRVADQVVSSAPATLHRKCSCPGGTASCPACEEEEVEQAKGIHRKAKDNANSANAVEGDFLNSPGPGQPLDPDTRSRFEAHFGRDLSGVRMHTDFKAADSAKSLGALAYTFGHDIVGSHEQLTSHTSSGLHLLAHELTHVVQQQGRGQPTVAAQSSLESKAEAKNYITGSIEFLEAGAQSYRVDLRAKSDTFDEAEFRRKLIHWEQILTKSLGIIKSALGGDPELKEALNSAYKNAIDAAVSFAANRNNGTPHSVFQQYRDLIAETALPQAASEPTGNELIAAVPQSERESLTEITTSLSFQWDDLFSTKIATTTVPLPPGVSAEFSSGITAKLQHGLTNVAGTIIPDPLKLNSTITLALNLEAYGGDYSAYRFSYIERKPKKGKVRKVVLIEKLGLIGVEGLSKTQKETARKKFDLHGFKQGAGWSDSELGYLFEAVTKIPDSILSPVDGLTFNRDQVNPKDPKRGGDYSPDTHLITIYDRAFGGSLTRFGSPGSGVSSETVRAISHEIGHAVDLLPLRRAWDRLETAQQAVKTAFAEFEDPPGSGSYKFPSSEQASWNRLSAAVAAAETSLTSTRSESGETYKKDPSGTLETTEGGAAAGSIEFRQAAMKDGGERITEYAKTNWKEFYAESFSLYITDPNLLQRLRPNIYQFFKRHHPM